MSVSKTNHNQFSFSQVQTNIVSLVNKLIAPFPVSYNESKF